MRNSREMAELETHIAMDKERFDKIDRADTELIESTLHQGFSVIPTELSYRGQKEALANPIRVGGEMLAGMRSRAD